MIRQLASREVYRNAWLRLREDDIEYPDGGLSIYTVLERPDFVTVIPYENGGFWLVQQYRYPLAKRAWEFPQGAWGHGRSGSVRELAAAELAEETGLRADELVQLGTLDTSPGLSSQRFHVFLATGLTPGEPERELSEADMVHEWRAEGEVRAMIGRGELTDSHSVAALALFDLHRG